MFENFIYYVNIMYVFDLYVYPFLCIFYYVWYCCCWGRQLACYGLFYLHRCVLTWQCACSCQCVMTHVPCWRFMWWWRHQMEIFPIYWSFTRGIHRSPVNSPHKGQWRGALMFSLICAWIKGSVNNREAGDSRRHRVHYDVTVMC